MNDINSNRSFEKKKRKKLEKIRESDQTVSEKAHIGAKDLEQNLLDQVVKKLQSKQKDMNKELLKYRRSMLDSSQKQYTDIIKECVSGLNLIKSLKKTSDLSDSVGESSKKIYQEAILESKNTTLVRSFEEAVEEVEKAKYSEHYDEVWPLVPIEESGKGVSVSTEGILAGKLSWKKKDWNWDNWNEVSKRMFLLIKPWQDYNSRVNPAEAIEKVSGLLRQDMEKRFEADRKVIVGSDEEAAVKFDEAIGKASEKAFALKRPDMEKRFEADRQAIIGRGE